MKALTYPVADGAYDLAPTCSTAAYDAGDVIFDRTELLTTLAPFYVTTVRVIDLDDNTIYPLDLWFLNADVTLGTAHAAPSISDANSPYLVGKIAIAAADWVDLGGVKVVNLTTASFGALKISPTEGSTGGIFLAAVNGTGTPAFESGLKIRVCTEMA